VLGSHARTSKDSKPCDRFEALPTSGLAENPTVLIPAACASSAQVSRRSGRNPALVIRSPSIAARAPTPWLRGCRPVKMEATDGRVQLDCETESSKTNPVAARWSSVGLGLGRAP
jgi:hypothetical protein